MILKRKRVAQPLEKFISAARSFGATSRRKRFNQQTNIIG
jgi:hypothetical protein